ncbi:MULTISPECIES: TRAP transporter substrate-binding protein [unclassified Desulfovibrio]|uniref:TRAP transporter substrate-binding protein n=1 Tax=unclassified Desulfovibrio TaxID=2593640 RepID=UPI0013ECB9DA|nr:MULTISPECIES: TRAP transporter substrate-binding protein [unclassified Desulfovibrio]
MGKLSRLLVLALVILFPSTIFAAGYTLRFAHDGAPDSVYAQTYRKFAELADKYTDGKAKVKLFENAVLGGDREVTESTQRGDLQMGGCGTSILSTFWPSAAAFDLPFIIEPEKKAALYEALNNGELGKYVNDELGKVGLVALVYADTPLRNYVTNKKPIPDLKSLKGVKMRTTASPVDNATAEALKMTPSPMGFAEVYTALQQGTIDGELLSFGDYYSSRRGDVVHHALPTQHSFTSMVGVINKQYFDSLPPEIQAGLKKAAVEASLWGQQLVDQVEQEGRAEGEKNKLVVYPFPPEERALFVEAVQPVYEKYVPNIDPKFLELLKATQK